MIHQAKFWRFKGIADQEISFDSLTMFVGANATGKSSVLEAIFLAIESCQADGRDAKWTEIAVDVSSRTHGEDTRVVCESDDGDFGFDCLYDEKVLRLPGNEIPRDFEDIGRWSFRVFPENEVARKEIAARCAPAKLLQLNHRSLAEPSYFAKTEPEMDASGFGLASVLASIKLAEDERFGRIVRDLKTVIPNLKRILIKKVAVNLRETEYTEVEGKTYSRDIDKSYMGDSLVFDFVDAEGVAAKHVSTGTLAILALLSLLHSPRSIGTLLLDDFGDFLHPLAQRQLIEICEGFAKHHQVQIIATTHSPFVLDAIDPGYIRLATLNEHGESVFGELEEHPEFNRWKDEMSPGDFWTMVGEKWVSKDHAGDVLDGELPK